MPVWQELIDSDPLAFSNFYAVSNDQEESDEKLLTSTSMLAPQFAPEKIFYDVTTQISYKLISFREEGIWLCQKV